VLGLAACGGGGGKTPTGYAIGNASLSAQAGDTIALQVLQTFSDGTKAELTAADTVTWSGVPSITALPAGSTAASPLPATGSAPTAFFASVPTRPDHGTDLQNVLLVRDAGSASTGTVTLTGTVAGENPGTVSATITVSASPTGDATNGATLFGAACSPCHGKTGHGTVANADGSYTLENMNYSFPAPGLNDEPGHVAGNSAWTVAAFAHAARASFDENGVTLRIPMPDWLSNPDPAVKRLLTTQDFADIYAFMKTQTM
jgi:cytochrome c553